MAENELPLDLELDRLQSDALAALRALRAHIEAGVKNQAQADSVAIVVRMSAGEIFTATQKAKLNQSQ